MLQEIHYAGHGKPQYRTYTVQEGTVFFFSNYDNWGEEIKGKKSFINPNKGIGIYKEDEKLFAAVMLHGLQTIMFINNGFGKRACWDTCNYPSSNDEKLEDIMNMVHEDTVFVKMDSLESKIDSLTEEEKVCLLRNFKEVLSKADEGISRFSNPEKVKEDEPIVNKIISLLE